MGPGKDPQPHVRYFFLASKMSATPIAITKLISNVTATIGSFEHSTG